jgi:hypothetical protein
MKNYLKQIAVTAAAIKASAIATLLIAVTAISVQAVADINMSFPTNPVELQGAFSGSQYVGGKKRSVEVLIHGMSMSGSFIITLIRDSSESKSSAQVFYAEILEDKTLGLISLGLSDDQGAVDDKMPPAALMKIAVNNKNVIQSIDITPQDGNSLLEGPVSLREASRGIQVSDVLAQGEYVGRDRANRSDSLKVYESGADVLVSGTVSRIGLSNDYTLSFDLTGVGALRARGYADHFQRRETQKITALLLPVKLGSKSGVILIKASGNGSSAPVSILKLK